MRDNVDGVFAIIDSGVTKAGNWTRLRHATKSRLVQTREHLIGLRANSATQFNGPNTSSPRRPSGNLVAVLESTRIISSSLVSSNVYDWTATLKAALHRIRGALSFFASRVNILTQPMNRVAAQGFESR
jgi:hypothetical protein